MVCIASPSKYLWRNLEEADFDITEFDKHFSKAPAKVKSPTSKSSEVKKAKVVSSFAIVCVISLSLPQVRGRIIKDY